LGNLAHARLRATDIPIISWSEQYRLRSLLKAEGVQIFHSPYYVTPYFFVPCKSVITICDILPAMFPQALPSRGAWVVYHLAMRLALSRANHLVTISETSNLDLQRLFGVRREKITVTYPGVEPCFHPRAASELTGVKSNYHLPDRFALYVGTNKPHKNLPRLIEAVALARKKYKFSLIIAGWEDSRWPQTRRMVERLGLGEYVHFLGPVPEDDLPALYNLASVFVLPSVYEGFGLPLVEAMASGTPCICSTAPALVEVAGDAAIQVSPYDTQAIASAILSVLEGEGQTSMRRAAGIARATQYNYATTARKTLEVYRRCLE
jgi:alpha-1,3-rhamnosyl/mannosyltransferase